ncbi:MAG TPA: aspartyl protease family protein [Thermoanaerobaculia bacterium]|nr:aspartyl protease family protein [Thermoanaerobaculia bacterium]
MLRAAAVATVLALTGCSLYNEVSVAPLNLTPADIERGADVTSMVRKADYLRAIELAPVAEARTRRSAPELASLGRAYLASGRFDEARALLRAALDLEPPHTLHAEIAWDLSQVEYLENNYEPSLEWAEIATKNGLTVRKWHLHYLKAMASVPVYRFSGTHTERLHFQFGRPDVPRIATRLNGKQNVEAVIDSGAVLSIISNRLAEQLPVNRFGDIEGTFFGLLGEPIAVRFGLIEKLELGGMAVENVPVAIMPDEKMRFLINKKEGIEFSIDFLLGSHLLKEFRLAFDFDRRNVTFTKLTEVDRRPDVNQNLFYNGFRPHVRGAVNTKGWFLFIIDTGSEITFLNETRISALPVRGLSGGHLATLQGLGGALKRGAKLEDVQVGVDGWNGTFKTIPMYSSDERELAVGIIGQNFLGKFNVVIDFGRMRVDLERR